MYNFINHTSKITLVNRRLHYANTGKPLTMQKKESNLTLNSFIKKQLPCIEVRANSKRPRLN